MIASANERTGEAWRAHASRLKFETAHCIGGEFLPSRNGATFKSVNPANDDILADVSRGGGDEIDLAVTAARKAFRSGAWSGLRPRERKEILLRFARLIEEHGETLALIDTLDMGKPIAETVRLDIPIAIRCLKFYAEAIDKFDGRVTATARDVLHYVMRQPMGVVGCIVPWNYPVMIAMWKIAPALAMGNTVILKPAEQSPLSAILLARLFLEAGGPAGVFNVVNGYGSEAGKALALHMDVDKIAFTGSVDIGKKMLLYAGQSNMKRISTECGGKCAHIIMDDVEDLAVAVDYAVHGAFENQGQICSAGSRIMVHRSLHEEFIDRFTQRTGELYRTGDPLDPEVTMGPMVTRRHRTRVLEYVETGKREGASLVFGGGVPTAGFDRGAFLEPTLFINVNNQMRISQEEIFGPVASIMAFDHFEDAIIHTNDSIYGLGAGIWTQNADRVVAFARRADVGIVWVNSFDAGDMTAPWGGFKQSGFGRDKGLDALEHYTQTKSVWQQIRNNLV